jgi:hypothetical protein
MACGTERPRYREVVISRKHVVGQGLVLCYDGHLCNIPHSHGSYNGNPAPPPLSSHQAANRQIPRRAAVATSATTSAASGNLRGITLAGQRTELSPLTCTAPTSRPRYAQGRRGGAAVLPPSRSANSQCSPSMHLAAAHPGTSCWSRWSCTRAFTGGARGGMHAGAAAAASRRAAAWLLCDRVLNICRYPAVKHTAAMYRGGGLAC